MKLELKHLAGYLPYGLKIIENDEDVKIEMLGIYSFNDIYTDAGDITFEGFKPILRPLSDLTKEIEVRAKKLIPVDYINENYYWDYVKDNLKYLITKNDASIYEYLPFMVVQKLLEWHFDIYGLIPSGLAIDINTLNK
jgi:hypothetical protein